MKKFVLPMLVAVTLVGAVFSGCAKPAAGPGATPSTTGSLPPNPMAGVAVKPDGTQYKLAYTPPFLVAEWCYVGDEVIKSLVKRAGGSITSLDPNSSPDKQLAIVDDFITMGVNGIMILPVDSSSIVPAIQRANNAGIPVFDCTNPIDDPSIVTSVSGGNYQMGYEAGRFLANYAKQTGKPMIVFELWNLRSMQSLHERAQGFADAVAKEPLVKQVIESDDTGYSNDTTMSLLADAFTAHPEINAVFSQGAVVNGIVQGLKAINKLYPVGDPNHIVVTTIDEETDTDMAVRDGWFDATTMHSAWELNDALTKLALMYVCCGNKDIPKEVIVPTYSITAANMNSPRWGEPALTGFMQHANFDLWPILDLPADLGVKTPTVKDKKAGY